MVNNAHRARLKHCAKSSGFVFPKIPKDKMARHRTSAQVSAAKRRFYERLQDGSEIIAERHLPDGNVIVYRALVVLLSDGRIDLKAIGVYRVKLPFTASIDKQVPGYPDWFVISGIPVCVAGRYTSIFAAIMRMAPYSD